MSVTNVSNSSGDVNQELTINLSPASIAALARAMAQAFADVRYEEEAAFNRAEQAHYNKCAANPSPLFQGAR